MSLALLVSSAPVPFDGVYTALTLLLAPFGSISIVKPPIADPAKKDKDNRNTTTTPKNNLFSSFNPPHNSLVCLDRSSNKLLECLKLCLEM